MHDHEPARSTAVLEEALAQVAERYGPTAQPPFADLLLRRRHRLRRRAGLGLVGAALATAVVTVAPGILTRGVPTLPAVSTPTQHESPSAPDEPVVDHPAVNWDAPVAWGIDVTEATAQEVAQADFDVRVPELDGRLIKIQATDPAQYPEDGGRGYGVLYDVATGDGSSEAARLLIEETLALPSDSGIARALAGNGAGFELEIVDGVEVCFIHPNGRASAIFIHDGIKFNVNGPALPLSVVHDAVTAIVRSSG